MPESKTNWKSYNGTFYAKQDTQTGNYNVYLKIGRAKVRNRVAEVEPISGTLKIEATGIYWTSSELDELKNLAIACEKMNS